MIFRNLTKYADIGILIIRIGLGIAFIMHGYPKMMGGMEKWLKLGNAMGNIGIHFIPAFWGFMAAFSEFGGGILFLAGFLFRPVCILLIITMGIALLQHISSGDSFGDYSHAFELLFVFLGLLFIGPGLYSLDSFFEKNQLI